MARQKGLVKSKCASVEPSAAMLIRIAFNCSSLAGTRVEMARQKGLEPLTYCLEGSCSIQLSYWRIYMERVTGIGPAYPAWKAGVLPLNYTRKSYILADSALGFYHNYTLLSRAFSRIIGIFL